MIARSVLVAMFMALALLLACQESESTEVPQATVGSTVTPQATVTPVPTVAHTPAPTPTRTRRPTPTATFTPTPTPTPLPSPLIAYAQQCGMVLFQLDSSEHIDDLALYTWAAFTQDMDQLLESYGGLIPPPELVQYHTVNLSAWTNLRDEAQQRPNEDSFIGDYLTFLSESHDELLTVAFNSFITEEEKAQLSEEILAEMVRDFFGQDTYIADQTAQQAFDTLRQEAREALGLHDCTPPLLLFDLDAETDSNEMDRAALMALYNATDGPNWNESTNWATDSPIGEWYGVATDAGGRVKHVKLSGNRMRGEMPPELGDLSSLRLLDLNGNQLRGEIPAELGNLANLDVLALRTNQLTGEIPAELGNLTNLRVLLLNGNELSGEIPLELANLTSLVNLSLNGNQLTGEIPSELGNLPNLDILALSGNKLTGEIPPELGNLANLDSLALSWNELTGEIPPELGNLTALTSLSLGRNRLTGEIPPELGNLTGLAELNLARTLLTGEVPSELGNLTNLYSLRISHNFMTGCVPSALKDVSIHDIHETPRLSFCD